MFKMVLMTAASAMLVAYCIYFDLKRRQDPDYKKKVRARRLAQRQKLQQQQQKQTKSRRPVFKDDESWKQYLMHELQLGQMKLHDGELEAGIEHLANALEISGNAGAMLQLWQQTLPPQIFAILIEVLQERNVFIGGDGAELESREASSHKQRATTEKVDATLIADEID